MALFGENGTETATFLPHAATGERVGGSGLGETQNVNPETGAVEYHTQEEWASIKARHTAKSTRESLAKKAHLGGFEDQVNVRGVAAGVVSLPEGGTVNLNTAAGIAKLSTAVWSKVVSAIEKTLKQTGDDRVQAAITGKLSELHGARAHSLTTKAVETSAKSVMSTLKGAPKKPAARPVRKPNPR